MAKHYPQSKTSPDQYRHNHIKYIHYKTINTKHSDMFLVLQYQRLHAKIESKEKKNNEKELK